MQTQHTALAAAAFLPAALWARTDVGAPAWILCLAGAVAVAGLCGFVYYCCFVVSGRCAQAEEDTMGVRRS